MPLIQTSITIRLRTPPLLVLLLALALPIQTALAQSNDDETPRVEKVTFSGVDAVPESSLRASIVTRETRCRGFLLQPFCWVVDWSLFVSHHELNRRELERDVVRLRVYYFRRGYREASVAAEVRPHDEGVEVVFRIDEGEPTLIDEIDIRQLGDVVSDRQIRRARFPKEDDVLNLAALEAAMTQVRERLATAGYLDGTVRDSIDIDRQSYRARVEVIIDPGLQSTLERLDISGNRDVDDATIALALRLKEGRVLRINDIVAARRSLYESNLFHEVAVDVPEQADSAKIVEVGVREAPPRRFRAGGGFNTLEFVQTEARFTHYDWLGAGRRLDLRATVGNLFAGQLNNRLIFLDVRPKDGFLEAEAFFRPTWQLSAGFRQPGFASAENVLALDLFANRSTIPGVVIDRGYGAEISVTRRVDYDTRLSISYAYELTAVEAGDLYFCVNYGVCEVGTIEALRGNNSLSPLSLGLQSIRTDNVLSPGTGHRLRADVEHASGLTMSDFRYNRLSAEGSYYFPLDVYRRRVLAGRLRIGWIRHMGGTSSALGVDIDTRQELLHPRKRFYAGGSRSVRGFGENQLGPRILTVDPLLLMEGDSACTGDEIVNGTCDPGHVSMGNFLPRPVGGTAVLEASAEYRFPFIGSMRGALFIDGGMVGEGISGAFSRGTWAVTPGAGVRFNSAVGPVRLDLGIRPGFTQRLPVVTEYVDEEGIRQLVRLETRRRYNPVEAAGGGFLQEVFSRLALHLSIGEAY